MFDRRSSGTYADKGCVIKYHPDKNPSPDAEEKFKEIRFVGIAFRLDAAADAGRSKAYQILSDSVRVVFSLIYLALIMTILRF